MKIDRISNADGKKLTDDQIAKVLKMDRGNVNNYRQLLKCSAAFKERIAQADKVSGSLLPVMLAPVCSH
jgi:hypothetical protein